MMSTLTKLKNLALLRANFDSWSDLEMFLSKGVNMLALLGAAFYLFRLSTPLTIALIVVAYYDGVTCLRSLKDKARS